MAAKYDQIASKIRAMIRDGAPGYTPGSRLEGENKLAADYKVSVPTFRRAIEMLKNEGLIDTEHGRGTFVRAPRRPVERRNDRHQWEKDRARASEAERLKTGATEKDTGLTINDLVFHAEYEEIDAGADIAGVFGVPVGTRVLHRNYQTRHHDEDTPFNVSDSYLLVETVAGNPDLLDAEQEPWPGGTQNQLWTVGIEVDRVEETFTARPPTAEETERLGIRPGVAVLALRKVLIDTSDRVVEFSDVILPGDRTKMIYTTQLTRW
ncbi:GntR family transcriptional regulator [Kitasatospora sp. NPDC051914]|uniref:GntR family transcriptional regulator n=1 Tax=Kitasatospora sp. NPDC051914 TaxID=3154945 RepID=UPI00341F63CA